MSSLVLGSPLAGWATPLTEVPDAVFAERMLGEGLAVDPTGQALCAPCAGTVIKVHAARHAVTMRTAEGADLLMHIGLDSVALGGDGFEVHVRDGQAVQAGDPLVSFDLDALAQQVRSLVTPVLVTNPEAFDVTVLASGQEVALGAPILRLDSRAGPAGLDVGGELVTRVASVTHPHGLHARPAAQIAAEAKRWDAALEISAHGRRASARSPVSIMALGVAAGDSLQLEGRGRDAVKAVGAILRIIDRINAAPAPLPSSQPVAARPPSAAADGLIRGVRAAPGLAFGPAWRLAVPEPPVDEASRGDAHEAAVLTRALAMARQRLQGRIEHTAGESRAVLTAHMALLEDPDLTAAALRLVAAGWSAGAAWRRTIGDSVAALQASGDTRLGERAADLEDLQRQVLWAVAGREPEPPRPPNRAILLADDLLPGDLAALESAGLAGLCTARGGPTSHVAVLAAAIGIPALVAAGPSVLGVPDGTLLVLDADEGVLDPRPSADRLAAVKAEIDARDRCEQIAMAVAGEPAHLADGRRIEVFANVGSLADAELAARNGAEGCGLLRTEFLFLDRATPPSEAEQMAAYQAIADALPNRPIIIRTLDVGGDKPAPYLALCAEENPALGVRGVRVSLRQPDMLQAQLRAILQVRPQGRCRIMAPMISSVAEIAAVRSLVEACAAELGHDAPVELGIMVETPAAAATVDLLAPEADFISIGTNDLSQYVLAMDRGNPDLAAEVDAMHPAVLRLIRLAASAAARHGRSVGVCGGLASDPAAVPILIGLGVDELSTTPSRVAATKALVRTLDIDTCRDLASRACDQPSAAAVRALSLAPAAR